MAQNINEQLYQLYSSKWDGLCSAIKSIYIDRNLKVKPANPFLIYIAEEEEFKNADIRVMIYGQETNTWCGKFKTDLEQILNCYDEFYNGGECWAYGKQFFNGFSKFKTMLEDKYSNKNKKIRFVWNNIVKIGMSDGKGFPPDYIYEVERNHFSVIKDELEIIKPNVVLFLTGPNYDSIIEDNFGKLSYTAVPGFEISCLAKIQLTGVDFAFRTYHPNYLYRRKIIDSVFQTIINKIKL